MVLERHCTSRTTLEPKTPESNKSESCLPASDTTPNAVTPNSLDLSALWASSNILPVAYAMMEAHLRTEAKHQGGRRRGGLCRGPGSGDRPAAPAGPHDLSHAATAVSARRRGFARSHRRTPLCPSRGARRCGARLGLDRRRWPNAPCLLDHASHRTPP